MSMTLPWSFFTIRNQSQSREQNKIEKIDLQHQKIAVSCSHSNWKKAEIVSIDGGFFFSLELSEKGSVTVGKANWRCLEERKLMNKWRS